MLCITEKIFNMISYLFMICYCVSYLCNDFRFLEPCFVILGCIAIASLLSEFTAYVILFPHERKK